MSDTHIEALEDEIARLFAEVFALTARALEKLAEFDARNGWRELGYQSAVHWLNSRIGISLATAREHVRVARALPGLPLIAQACRVAPGVASRGSLRSGRARLTHPALRTVLKLLGRVGQSGTTETPSLHRRLKRRARGSLLLPAAPAHRNGRQKQKR